MRVPKQFQIFLNWPLLPHMFKNCGHFIFKKSIIQKAHLIQIASNIFTFTNKIAIIALPMYNLRIYTTLPILMSNPKFNLHGWK